MHAAGRSLRQKQFSSPWATKISSNFDGGLPVSNHPTHSAEKTSTSLLNRQIGMYSLAAAVASVSMLALAEPASGEVVITRKTIHVPIHPYLMPDPTKISMAGNGVDNFSFVLASVSFDGGLRSFQAFGATQSDGVIAGGTYFAEALPLTRGAKIGPSANFFFGPEIDLVEGTNTSNGVFYSRGYWKGNLTNRYLGVRFQLNGQTHYGWVRMTVTSNVNLNKPTLEATITAYAYETVPNKPILAGTAKSAAATEDKPTATLQVPGNRQDNRGPSLGMLAGGADALPMWRHEGTSVRQ
jgi:hypothetical protein